MYGWYLDETVSDRPLCSRNVGASPADGEEPEPVSSSTGDRGDGGRVDASDEMGGRVSGMNGNENKVLIHRRDVSRESIGDASLLHPQLLRLRSHSLHCSDVTGPPPHARAYTHAHTELLVHHCCD